MLLFPAASARPVSRPPAPPPSAPILLRHAVALCPEQAEPGAAPQPLPTGADGTHTRPVATISQVCRARPGARAESPSGTHTRGLGRPPHQTGAVFASVWPEASRKVS